MKILNRERDYLNCRSGVASRVVFYGFMLLVAILMLNGCGSDREGDEIGLEKSVKASVVRVENQQIPDLHFFPGVVKSKVSITLAAKMPGYVRDMPHEIGDFVRKDELLVGLDDTDIKSGIAALEQSFRAVTRQRDALRARLHYVETTWKRIKTLHDEGSATQDELDRITSERSALSGQVAAMEAQARQVRARLNEARNQLHYVTIKAPADGTLVSKMVDRGAFVMPGVPLVQFQSSGDGAWFAADVDEALMNQVRAGMPVNIYIPSVQQMVDASVTQMAPDSKPSSHTFSILCDISSTGLASGLYGRIFIDTGHKEKLLVPCGTLVDRGGVVGVFVADSERKVHWRVIKTGDRWHKTSSGYSPLPLSSIDSSDACFAEVLTGLSVGENIVASNLNMVREGFRLE